MKRQDQRLNVWPRGQALVHDFDALDEGHLRFVGRTRDVTIGDPLKDRPGERSGAWVPHGQPSSISHRWEHRHALLVGDLLPADEATAKLVGLPWPYPLLSPELSQKEVEQ